MGTVIKRRLLPDPLPERKCHLGQGEASCSYLAMTADGFECAFGMPDIAFAILKRRESGTMNAMGDKCADPYDDVSESVPPK